MSFQPIIIGTADARQGDTLFTGAAKINDNFTELFNPVIGDTAVYVSQESEFPTQDATTITLDAKTRFIQTADISTSKNFICLDGSSITTGNIDAFQLSFTGTGSMFSGTDANFFIHNITVDPGIANTAFTFIDTVGTVKKFIADTIQIQNCNSVGSFDNLSLTQFINSNSPNANTGIQLLGANNLIYSFDRFALASTSATFIGIDFGASQAFVIEFNNVILNAPTGGIGFSGLINSGNVPSGSLGTITKCDFSANITPLQNISPDDIRWAFGGNNAVRDTNPDLLISLTGNATATTVSGGTPALLSGTWNAVERASQFTGTTAGRGTFLGERPMAGPIDISVTVEPSSGNNKDISAYVAIDGVFQANSQTTVRVDNANPKTIAIPWQTDFVNGKFIEIFVSNDTDDVSVIGKSAILRIR